MAKLFLRSGNLDDFLALGENGQPVYASALQLRETLRLRKQQPIADCLAIPQPNEKGDRIDWYAPIAGKMTSWMAASDEQREYALELLEQYQQTIAAISEKAQSSEKPALKLFGVLLAKAIQFPGPNHVYLVDDKPVITFWGFVNLGKKFRADALECLRPVAPPEPPAMVEAPEPEPLEAPEPEIQEPEPDIAPVVSSEPAPAFTVPDVPKPASRSVWLRAWWLIPCAGLLVTLGMQMRSCVSLPPSEKAPSMVVVKPEKRVLDATSTPVESPLLSFSGLPLGDATIIPPVAPPAVASEDKAPDAAPASDAAHLTPAPKGVLVMPPESIRVGSVRFLNGNWQATAIVKNPLTGKPPVLRYQIQNGKGRVRFTYGDKVTCRADVEAGLHQSGNLVINSRYRARCSDGSRYSMPEVVCNRVDTAEAADCKGRFDADTILPMTIKRESK
ncbi:MULTISPECIES: SrfA family protein [Lonsdalea]|uniref:Uncharacterized protein n=4 Tax=Lonsdalea TaxID=1082702 RepID=A0ACD1J9E5_9GAMM|nr:MULTISPECIES: SrfA family protein [Lonsdalea]OSM99631.1 hypothetical protein AU508_01285 [Lonsdalea populi]RAT11683.1 hypothetical protein AU485_13770 [Lonsdalea quercina]RAT19317.1 hypothetical protein AU487_11575 [Lonsdalea populi]RAT22907.1 hypothetical protein AU488_10505 [Lonsdalea populi]RAT25122.1 hypothetical protein AU489_07495 [Lonsdalea populi]